MARYYRAAERANLPVSSEISGYTASALAYLFKRTGTPAYLDAAVETAEFLTRQAWDPASHTFPFEPGSDRAYFFDLGIIARGLMSVFRLTGRDEFRSRAKDAALSLGFDFLGENTFYPVISIPMKEPLPEEPRWSRQPGCYQLKSALIWRDMEEEHAGRMFDVALAMALATHGSFLDGEPDRARVMDRMHAYCYFLEALLAATDLAEARDALKSGIAQVASLLREISPSFERSDVWGQLLRVRLIADNLGVVALDEDAAAEEAARAASFQAVSDDPHIHGGFWFGRKDREFLPFSNPVSTAFCIQALGLWNDYKRKEWTFTLADLI